MSNQVMGYSFLIICGAFISAISQVILKKSTQKKHDNFLKEYMNPLVMLAYLLFLGTTFLSVIAYKIVPLSFGPILESTGYIYITVFGVKFFGEKINGQKIIGMVLIIVGIIIYAIWG